VCWLNGNQPIRSNPQKVSAREAQHVICMKIRTPRPIFGLNRFSQASKSADKLHHVALRLQAMKSVSCFHTICLKRHKSFVLTLFECLL